MRKDKTKLSCFRTDCHHNDVRRLDEGKGRGNTTRVVAIDVDALCDSRCATGVDSCDL